MDTERWFGVGETCARIGVKHTKFYELVAAEKIKATKNGSKSGCTASEINRYIASLPALNTSESPRAA
jgi:hypothetical protein